jgi:hypothetical protein
LWQVEQDFSVCRLNAGIASAVLGATIANTPETATLNSTAPNKTRRRMTNPFSP